ncbi:hypothetical protein PBI_SCTP2_276 [Salicola phage SCTP-2]|nr:hypothetical protein PBI_SCTP2_276 [Salicola phage SCTP-2]
MTHNKPKFKGKKDVGNVSLDEEGRDIDYDAMEYSHGEKTEEDYLGTKKYRSVESNMDEECAECCLHCLRMITNSHLWHLQTENYATHEALEEFYTELNDKCDRLIEISIQLKGHIGRETVYNLELVPYNEMVDEIGAFKEVMNDMQERVEEDSAEHIIEEILSLIDHTLYKLNYLN